MISPNVLETRRHVPGFLRRVERARKNGQIVRFMVGAAIIELRPFDVDLWPFGDVDRRVMVVMRSMHDGKPLDWWQITSKCRPSDRYCERIIDAGRLIYRRKGEKFPGWPTPPLQRWRFSPVILANPNFMTVTSV